MYLSDLAAKIRAEVPIELIPNEGSDELFVLYAALARAKGSEITESDIHDAWSVWLSARDPSHAALVPYEQLPDGTKALDTPFVKAIQTALSRLKSEDGSSKLFASILFPSGNPKTEAESKELLELYKTMVGSSEALVQRRQTVNTFFLTINGALLTACGLLVQSAGAERLGALGVGALAIAGLILCGAWRSLITSFGQLNRGKFKVIGEIEKSLKAAIYAAEWEALERGENPKVYRSFTSREIWVPNALLAIHGVTLLVSLIVAVGWVSLRR
jgi:hypothetical protein